MSAKLTFIRKLIDTLRRWLGNGPAQPQGDARESEKHDSCGNGVFAI
jgi:hypothetical protein